MAESLYRQWIMLRLLPREPRAVSTRSVWERLGAHGYAVTKRTVERDLDALSGQFGYTSEVRDGTTYWFWPALAQILDVPALEPAGALALALAHDHLAPLLPASVLELMAPYFSAALQTLRTVQGNRVANWRNKVRVLTRGPALRNPAIDSRVHATISDALMSGCQISALYHSRAEEAGKEILLHPLAMVVKDGVFYLVATAWDYLDVRHYAVHRFASAVSLPESAKAPPGFSLDAYLEKSKAFSYPSGAGEIKLVLLVDSGVAEHLRERPLSADQYLVTKEDGWSQVTATVDDTEELRWWILGLGEYVRVVKPARVAHEIQRVLLAASKNYSDN